MGVCLFVCPFDLVYRIRALSHQNTLPPPHYTQRYCQTKYSTPKCVPPTHTHTHTHTLGVGGGGVGGAFKPHVERVVLCIHTVVKVCSMFVQFRLWLVEFSCN